MEKKNMVDGPDGPRAIPKTKGVYEFWTGSRTYPKILLQGKRLQNAGWNIGDRFTVELSADVITIRRALYRTQRITETRTVILPV